MFCPECGYKNKDENKFCLSCGKSLAPKKQMEKQLIPNYNPEIEEEKRKDRILESAIQYMNSGGLEAYKIAHENLNKISDWKNAEDLKKQCEDKINDKIIEQAERLITLDNLEALENALEYLNKISNWKNAAELKNQCETRISEIQQEKLDLKKKHKKIALFISAPVAAFLVVALIIGILITPKLKYDEASKYLDNSDYAKASEIFGEIKDYKDSATALTYISVLDGSITDYDKKVKILESLGDYRDSAKILLDLKYEKAAEFAADKNYLEAINLIDSLGDYGDPDNIKQNIYKTAVEHFNDRKFSEAAEIFLILGKYEDTDEYIEKIYNQAGTYFKDKKYNYAAAVYMSLGDYSESKDKVEELYKKCLDYIDKEKYAEAALILRNLKTYSDAEKKLEFLYNKALSLIGYGKYSDASSILANLKDYGNSKEKLAELDEKLNNLYNDAVKMSYNNYKEAIKLFEELGDYKDSNDKIKDLKNKIEKKEEAKKNADTYEMKSTTAWVKIDNGYLNVRASASSDSKSVGKLYNGDEVTIQATSSNGKWYKVTSGSITGYCSVDYISTSKPIANISGSWIETEDSIESSMFDLSGEWQQIGGTYSMTLTKDGDNYKAYIEYEDSDGHYNKIRFTAKPSGSNNSYSYNLGMYELRFSKTDISAYYSMTVNGYLIYSNGYLLWDCYYADSGEIFENNINIQFERN